MRPASSWQRRERGRDDGGGGRRDGRPARRLVHVCQHPETAPRAPRMRRMQLALSAARRAPGARARLRQHPEPALERRQVGGGVEGLGGQHRLGALLLLHRVVADAAHLRPGVRRGHAVGECGARVPSTGPWLMPRWGRWPRRRERGSAARGGGRAWWRDKQRAPARPTAAASERAARPPARGRTPQRRGGAATGASPRPQSTPRAPRRSAPPAWRAAAPAPA